ncbi:MAG: ATPase/DNA packaging protein [Bacteroidota bacterium]
MPIEEDNQAVSSRTLLVPEAESTFTLAASGGIGKGKSRLLRKLAFKIYKEKFNRCITVNPSGKLDKDFKKFLSERFLTFNVDLDYVVRCEIAANENERRLETYGPDVELLRVKRIKPHITTMDPEDFHTKYSIGIIEELVEEQTEIIEKYGKSLASNILLVFDDSIASACFSRSHTDLLSILISNCRHLKISVIFAVQKFRCIPSLIRENLTAVMFFESSPKELETIHDTFDLEMPFSDWLLIMQSLFKKEYDYIQINLRNNKKHRLIYKIYKFVILNSQGA